MEIKWLGHSCFKLTSNGKSVVCDPFAPDSIPGVGNISETADMVLCSHGHFDHNYAAAVTIKENASADIKVSKITVAHDDVGGTKRGLSDIHVIEMDGVKVAHMGDIGCELTSGQQAALAGLDVLLIPVGGFFTIDAAQAAAMTKTLGAKITIPMHYSGEGFGFDAIKGVDLFTEKFDATQVMYAEGNTLDTEAVDGQKIVVLKF